METNIVRVAFKQVGIQVFATNGLSAGRLLATSFGVFFVTQCSRWQCLKLPAPIWPICPEPPFSERIAFVLDRPI